MIRFQEKDLRFRAEITVFVSLVFMLILSLVGALLSSAAFYNQKSSVRANMQLALESVFAEYDTNLLEQYDLFARADTDEQQLGNRLQYYGITNTDHRIVQSVLLTDNCGLAYYQGAVQYMKDLLGLDYRVEDRDLDDFIPDANLNILERETEEQLTELLSQDENTLLEEENPLGTLQNLKNSNLLSFLILNQEDISNRKIELDPLPSHRTLETGVGIGSNANGTGGMAEKALFVEYLCEHFGDFSGGKEDKILLYELEYLLCGKGEDRENLEKTLQKILWIRMGINYAYLLTDQAKQGEVEALAAVLCTLATSPELIPVVKQALLLAWAYGESVVELRMLMKQDRVPPVKTSETWRLKLSNLGKLDTDFATGEGEAENGLSYSDYVKGLLLVENRETLCMRSLDLMEQNLSIKMDRCMVSVQVESSHYLREGLTDRFPTSFYYQ